MQKNYGCVMEQFLTLPLTNSYSIFGKQLLGLIYE